mmetsp:Transcript_3796/g.14994  ORF Transcript_3796/g.14994 Transcript_3796/m.14994 type:complete len:275 (+) Transcript_3796:73-897(+)
MAARGGRHHRAEDASKLRRWVRGLGVLAACHVAHVLFGWRSLRACGPSSGELSCHVIAAVGTAYRAWAPVFWTGPYATAWRRGALGTHLVDQTVSQVAESAYALQVSLATTRALDFAAADDVARALAPWARWMFLGVWLVARPCCWAGVLTERKEFHVVEEAVWGVFALGAGAAMAVARREALGLAFGVLAVATLAFDVPMYVSQARAAARRRRRPPSGSSSSPRVSLRTMLRRMLDVPLASGWAAVREDIPWMTVYLGGAPLFSRWVSAYPTK